MATSRDGEFENEYVWRFRLDGRSVPPLYDDPVQEMIRAQLVDLLDVVILTEQGREVRVDGFKLMSDLRVSYALYPPSNQQNIAGASASEEKDAMD